MACTAQEVQKKKCQMDLNQGLMLPPIPTTEGYARDKWTRHPLLLHSASKQKRKLDEDIIVKRARLQKLGTLKKLTLEGRLGASEECNPDRIKKHGLDVYLNQDDFIDYLRTSVRAAPISSFPETWKTRILNQIPKSLKAQLPDLYDQLQREIEEGFGERMQEAVLGNMIKRGDDDEEHDPGRALVIAKMPFLTEEPPWSKQFTASKNLMEEQLHLTDPLVHRTLLKIRTILFQQKLIDWNIIRELKAAKPTELREAIRTQIKENGEVISTQLQEFLNEAYWNLRSSSISKAALSAILATASNIIITNCRELARQIVIDVTEAYVNYRTRLPHIILETEILNGSKVTLYPDLEENMYIVRKIFEEIEGIFANIPDIESLAEQPSESGITQFRIKLRSDFLEAALEPISEVIKIWLSKPVEFLQETEKQFKPILSGEARKKALEFIEGEHSFTEGITSLQYYKDFSLTTLKIPKNVYYERIILNNEDAMVSLQNLAELHVEIILNKLLDMYRKHCKDIIASFQEIELKLTTEPKTTAELVELIDYIDDARGRIMLELQEKIAEGNKMYFLLLEFHIFDTEDSELSVNAQSWNKRIQPAFEKSAIMVEDKKVECEERLAEKIEQMKADLKKLLRRVRDDFARYGDYEKCGQYVDDLKYVRTRVEALQQGIDWINNEETLFKFSLSKFPEMDEILSQLEPYTKLFTLAHKWQLLERKYMDGDFKLDAEAIDAETEELQKQEKELLKLQKLFKNRIKAQKQLEAEAKHIPISLLWDEDNLDQVPPPLKICNKALESLAQFREYLPFIAIMCNPGLQQRHWDQMNAIAGFDITPDTGTSLRKLLQMDLEQYMLKFEQVSLAASKEHALEESVNKMQADWANVKLNTTDYKDTGIKILANMEDMQLLLEEHITKTQMLKGSPFVKPHEAKVKAWEQALLRSQETTSEWLNVQAQWLYLEPVFSSPDIQRQMPEEAKLFKKVDQIWRQVMAQVNDDANAIELSSAPGMLEKFQECISLLERINKGLNAYLEQKRLFFPRFFFLSNDEMLEILSETKDPLRVQPHLKKLFEGISKLQFDSDLMSHAMFSAEGERVYFSKPVDTNQAHGCVERWLADVETVMVKSLKDIVGKAKDAYVQTPRSEWVIKWPGQVVLCVSQIFWTTEVHESLSSSASGGLSQYLERLNTQLNDIVALVRGQLTKQARITLGALVTVDVHARDVVDEMKGEVQSDTDFKWLAQLRYYYEDYLVKVRIINAAVPYAYEYLGNSPRLVITPLTDRCYRTLISAYHLHLNGAPEGPAGTGKTETTKDLAKALAVQCVVFNCSDGLDYIAMGKFFKGLAASGAWACFDEFNRIELEVLSVIAQQILSIIRAVQSNVDYFLFEGTELKLNKACYVCITMNPGYAGRSELPDNLKVLFRTVAMMVPDYAMIGEISLYSTGFVSARKLAVKIVTTYRLCSEQLSSQFHYDYGMRAVKSVLLAAANLKLKFPFEDEELLLLRSIIDVNLPKFLSHDIPLFEGIISDLFPGAKLPAPEYTNLFAAVETSCKSRNLQAVDIFKSKVSQMYEMMIVRHGFMLVGDPFAGKTSVIKVLADALTLMEERGQGENKVKYETINPKAITMGQLYGNFDPASHEWSDGVGATVFRNFANEESDDRKWVIFDGPVDAVWIENMNSVLDDNKKLCLMSGEIIQMTAPMSLIFEAMDLAQASPATVSRCGMVYLEPAALGWKVLLQSWIYGELDKAWHADNCDKFIYDFSCFVLTHTLKFIRKQCKEQVKTQNSNLVNSYIRLVTIQLKDLVKDLEKDGKNMRIWLTGAMMFAIPWSVGGVLDSESRAKFDTFFRLILSGKDGSYPFLETMPQKLESQFPADNTVYDFFFEIKGRGTWRHWNELVRSFELPLHNEIRKIIVPTVDTARYTFLMDMCIKSQVPLLIIGPTGTGKTVYVQEKLMNGLSQDEYMANFVTFSAQITANQTQDLILSRLDKKGRGNYSPPGGKKCVVFIDDMNLPATEMYGAQPPIELLRQFFDHKLWYDKKDTSKIFLQDVQFLAVMGPPGGSRQNVTPRFTRHFNMVAINSFADETVLKIYQTLMQTYLRNSGFSPEYFGVVIPTVASTMEVYKGAMATLLPTPAKSHYTFNLRDFARVIQGCCLINRASVDSKRIFVRLWTHEVLRVFYDRLVDDTDRAWLFRLARTCVQNHFKESFEVIFESLASGGPKSEVKEEDMKNLMFGNFMNPDADREERVYAEIRDMDQYSKIVQLALQEHNSTSKNGMDLVIFRYVLDHLVRICRILCIPGGHGLLVGVGGSGRQSMTRLAASMSGYQLFQPEISKQYARTDWRSDLKKAMKNAGAYNRDTVLLISDSQVKEEGYLEDVDSLLNSGDVPNVFTAEESGEIHEAVMPAWFRQSETKNRSAEVNPLALYAFFVGRIKDKLHIMIAFSPIGSLFRNRLRQYPSLVNCCTIDWFQPWPEQALEKLAQKFLQDVDIPADLKKGAVRICKYFHVRATQLATKFRQELGRYVYVTPNSYLELILTFKKVIQGRKEETMNARLRYLAGLEKLAFASGEIANMKKELSALMPELRVAAEATASFVQVIEKESQQVEQKSALVKEDESVAHAQAEEASKLKAECLEDLAEALPLLEKAKKALEALSPADINFMKTMKSPPKPIRLVMAAVCVMKNVKPDMVVQPDGSKGPDFWPPSKRILGDINFFKSLEEYDKDHIPPEVMQNIRTNFLGKPEFSLKVISKASTAAESLYRWIIAMEAYDKVAKVVAPKKARLEAAEAKLKQTMDLLNAKRGEIEELEAKLKNLREQFEETNKKKLKLEGEANLCKKKLERAEKLIGGLGGEKLRWEEAAANLQVVHNNLGADVLIASAQASYLGPYTANFRQQCIHDWVKYISGMGISCSKQFSLAKTLGSPIKIQSWNINGLPNDSFSVDNAIMVHVARRFPLMIDPQGQANKWLKNTEKDNSIQIVKMLDGDFMRKTEYCISTGTPLLLENVSEEIDPALLPILEKKTFKQAGMDMIRLGDLIVEFHPDFRFYITTKLRNPHYLPEVSTKVLLLNFMITVEGLEDQLLGIVVAKERPELEEERQELIVQTASNTRALKEVEDNILDTLSSSQGNILEDETAINILDSSKEISADILQKQKVTAETEKQIEKSRLGYRPVAKYTSVLFFALTELPNIDPMYQYSLTWFVNLFISSIEHSNRSKQLEKRLKNLCDHFTLSLYNNVCRSLFEKDKLLFSFTLCVNILMSQGKLHMAEYRFLLMGGVGLENTSKNPASNWLPSQAWDELCRVKDAAPVFRDFVSSFQKDLGGWKAVFESSEPHTMSLPAPWQTTLSDFEKMIVIRCLRPDKLVPMIVNFVQNNLGEKFVTPPPFDLAKSYADSSSTTPLLFILSPGADPTSVLLKFAQDSGFGGARFEAISLGQGQGPIAAQMISVAQEEGTWVALQNCHLAASWMPTLEKICEDMGGKKINPSFRLWLTSYPSPMFPVTILQNSVKMTNEPPTGLRQNLLRSYSSDPINDADFYSSVPTKERAFQRLLFGLCFFHAVVQERRKFGPLGWNIPYEFNESDLKISLQQLQMFLQDSPGIPFEALSYCTGECNYGGRVTDDKDRRLLMSLLSIYYCPEIVDKDKYTLSPSGVYYTPKDMNYEPMLMYLRKLPLAVKPEVYGLHENANVTRSQKDTQQLLDGAILTLVESSGGSEDKDSGVKATEIAQDILGKLPQEFDMDYVEEKYPVDYMNSMNTVLRQELVRFNPLIAVVRTTLINVQKAIKGLVVMTPDLDQVYKNMLIGKVPLVWVAKSYPSLKPLGAYVLDLFQRLKFLQNWIDNGAPTTFWLSGFYFTQSFLTGVLQNFARKHATPIDLLGFDYQVTQFEKTASKSPSEGAYCWGLFLEGARWDRDSKKLAESKQKILFDTLPVVWFKPGLKANFPVYSCYESPVYKTSARRGVLSTTGHSTNFVLYLKLPTDMNPKHWINRGTACLCQLDD